MSSIRARWFSSESEKPLGEGWVYWQEVFQLCRDIPKLLGEIDRLKVREKELKQKILDLKQDYECEF